MKGVERDDFYFYGDHDKNGGNEMQFMKRLEKVWVINLNFYFFANYVMVKKKSSGFVND